MKYRTFFLVIIIACCLACNFSQRFSHHQDSRTIFIIDRGKSEREAEETRRLMQEIIETLDESQAYHALCIETPLDNALFPIDMASPIVRWTDDHAESRVWFVRVSFEDTAEAFGYLTENLFWIPDAGVWDAVKRRSVGGKAQCDIVGVAVGKGIRIVSRGGISFSTSPDPVGDGLFYLQMPLPFSYAQKHPELFRWSLADLSSYTDPSIVLHDVPLCANCHSFSRDGAVMGLDIDYHGDKGSYILAGVGHTMNVSPQNIISWNDCPRTRDDVMSFGFFPKISPRGDYVIATVDEKSFFVQRRDPAFSQFFFLADGKIAWYSVADRTFSLLPGAADPAFVQTCPEWSPDGRFIVFSRASVDDALVAMVDEKKTRSVDPETSIEELGRRFHIEYDLYRIPFNEGRGGKPVPVSGAGNNGMSNYFPRWSPDGKWILFCRSDNGLALQPDSRLCIVPAAGGEVRELRANRPLMNSWHSWSSNGKWIVFSSKGATVPFTAFYLCHIDDEGNASVPVLLDRLQDRDVTNMVPEFVSFQEGGIASIRMSGME